MDTASDYRELVTQQLRTWMPDIITLDLGKLSSKGITLGSSFKVALLMTAGTPHCSSCQGTAAHAVCAGLSNVSTSIVQLCCCIAILT